MGGFVLMSEHRETGPHEPATREQIAAGLVATGMGPTVRIVLGRPSDYQLMFLKHLREKEQA